jgi:hypothetical protein
MTTAPSHSYAQSQLAVPGAPYCAAVVGGDQHCAKHLREMLTGFYPAPFGDRLSNRLVRVLTVSRETYVVDGRTGDVVTLRQLGDVWCDGPRIEVLAGMLRPAGSFLNYTEGCGQ